MVKIMEVCITKADAPDNEAYAALELPATPFEFFDALDKARVQQGDELYFEITEYLAFDCLEPYLSGEDNIVELNVLCQKLSELSERQCTAFQGLLIMETEKKEGPISLGKLIDLAYSTDCCHVVNEALNDSQLGQFYAENGFVPDMDGISDRLFGLMDFKRIGQELRQGEGGVFTEHGYVVRHSELNVVHDTMSFHIRTPDYQILLELPDGSQLELPCDDPPEAAYHVCLDCRIPRLMAAIDETDMDSVNAFAELLKDTGDKPLRKLKAAVNATGCDTLDEAFQLAEQLDHFMLDEKVDGYRSLALEELRFIMGENEMALLKDYVNLDGYGKAVLKRDNAVITPYGHLARDDYQPILSPQEQEQGGMEMK